MACSVAAFVGFVGDRGLIEDVDAGVGFRRRWLLGTDGCGGGPFLARALSGVEEVDDTLSCGCLAVPFLGLGQGQCVVDLTRVLGAGEVLCVEGAQLHGDHLMTVSVLPELDGLLHLLVVGAGWLAGSNPLWLPVTWY